MACLLTENKFMNKSRVKIVNGKGNDKNIDSYNSVKDFLKTRLHYMQSLKNKIKVIINNGLRFLIQIFSYFFSYLLN